LKTFILIMAVILFAASLGQATTTNLADCAYTTVNNALTAATAGDTLVCPAGSWTWATMLTITKPIIIKGAGTGCPSVCNGATTITSNGSIGALFGLAMNGDMAIDVSGFTLDANGSGAGFSLSNASASPVYNMRLHHNEIKNASSYAIRWNGDNCTGDIYGLIDNNKFTGNSADFKPYGNNTVPWASYPYSAPSLGSVNYLYVEDNISTGANGYYIFGSGCGARWVYRKNHASISSIAGGGNGYIWDSHGNQTNNPHGTNSAEIYDNHITAINNGYNIYVYRAGNAIMFDNTIPVNNGGDKIDLYVDYRPCVEAPKNGYFWNNVDSGTGWNVAFYNDATDCVVEQTDLWVDSLTNWTFSAANVSTYFTKGLSSARNGSVCTAQTVYWETDTRKLYRCTATNTWTQIYTPYIYPHPLQGATLPTSVTGCTLQGVTLK
jgi:hypothetical protein